MIHTLPATHLYSTFRHDFSALTLLLTSLFLLFYTIYTLYRPPHPSPPLLLTSDFHRFSLFLLTLTTFFTTLRSLLLLTNPRLPLSILYEVEVTGFLSRVVEIAWFAITTSLLAANIRSSRQKLRELRRERAFSWVMDGVTLGRTVWVVVLTGLALRGFWLRMVYEVQQVSRWKDMGSVSGGIKWSEIWGVMQEAKRVRAVEWVYEGVRFGGLLAVGAGVLGVRWATGSGWNERDEMAGVIGMEVVLPQLVILAWRLYGRGAYYVYNLVMGAKMYFAARHDTEPGWWAAWEVLIWGVGVAMVVRGVERCLRIGEGGGRERRGGWKRDDDVEAVRLIKRQFEV